MSPQEWMVLRGGKEFGPYDYVTLTKMARTELLTPTDTVIDWATKSSTFAYELPNLFPEYVPPRPAWQQVPRPSLLPPDPIEKNNTPVLIALSISAITICLVFLASATYMETALSRRLDPSLTRQQLPNSIALQLELTSNSGGTQTSDLLNKCQGLPFLDKPGDDLPALPTNIQGQWYILAKSTDKGRNAEVIPTGKKNPQNWIFNEKSVQMSTNYGYLTSDLVPSDAEETANMEIPVDLVSSFGDVEGMPTYMLHSPTAKTGVVWFFHHDINADQVLWRSIDMLESKEINRTLLGRDLP